MIVKHIGKRISVWVVEDNDLYRKSIATLIDEQNDMFCSGIYDSCETAVKAIRKAETPDVILHDIGFSGMNGITCVETIKTEFPSVQIIMVTVYNDGEHIFDALCAGATGYLLKSSTEAMIIDAVHDVVAGGSPMNSSIARKVVEVFAKSKKVSKEYGLTDRERDILEYIIQGFSNGMIAKKIHLSVHTIDAHLRKIYEKLHVHTRTEAAAKAVKERLI